MVKEVDVEKKERRGKGDLIIFEDLNQFYEWLCSVAPE